MAFDKAKTLRAVERYLELGKIPAAIKEYSKIVAAEPTDFTTLNILGDLHVRVGNPSAAIKCFRRIAEHYREQCFALKAIAMFKKIDRLQPGNIDIATNLADLYAQQDLIVEARSHYLAVASAYATAGDTKSGLGVLAKIADLDPQNTDVRIKLADGYQREGMTDEAANALAVAGHNLLARGALDEALDAYNRSLKIKPGDSATLSRLLATHSACGTADEAAEMIAAVSSEHPNDLDLLSMRAQAYIAAEDPQHAEATTAALIERDPSLYLRSLDVSRLYMRLDKIDDAVSVVDRIAEQMLAEREEIQLLEMVNEFLACDSDNVEALRLLVRAHWWQRDGDNLKAALERLAEAAQAAALIDDERYALTQLTRLAPENADYSERLSLLGGAIEEAAAEVLPEFDTVASCEPKPEVPGSATEYVMDAPVTAVSEAEPHFDFSAVCEQVEGVSEAG